eukprot:jgi/Chrzof1/7093/Cz02g10170.t1
MMTGSSGTSHKRASIGITSQSRFHGQANATQQYHRRRSSDAAACSAWAELRGQSTRQPSSRALSNNTHERDEVLWCFD